MAFSFIAMNRVVEQQCASDEKFRKQVQRSGRPLLSIGRKLSNEKILEKLRILQFPLDSDNFERVCFPYLSAEEWAGAVTQKENSGITGFDGDWLWICLEVLWERWAPHIPNMEMIDDAIQKGYDRLKRDAPEACRIWLRAWSDLLKTMDRGGVSSIHDMQERFAGTQYLTNWVQDLEMELGNTATGDPRLYVDRIRYCEEYLERFGNEHGLIRENMKRAITDSYWATGEGETVESLYRSWLAEDPAWGCGWMGWSDCYWLMTRDRKQYYRAEEILKQGLAVENLRDRDILLERLFDLYAETGWKEQADKVRNELEQGKATARKAGDAWPVPAPPPPPKKTPRFSQPAPPPGKISRNAPCPCGSGKKYKRCCGS